jgi:hypothetical protein
VKGTPIMAKHEAKPKGNARAVLRATGKGVKATAKGVAATGRGVNKALNFCMNPLCLHDARTAKCKRDCCN